MKKHTVRSLSRRAAALVLALALALPTVYAHAGEQKLQTSIDLVDGLTYRNTITDNSERRVESFSLELDSGIVRHIGLYNIHKMLSLLYGASYGLKIESELGVGTRVELRMPYEMEESSC